MQKQQSLETTVVLFDSLSGTATPSQNGPGSNGNEEVRHIPQCSSNTVKLATIVEGDQKASFSIATTPRCREGTTPFPGLLHFTLDTYLILLSVKQGDIKYHF